MVWPALTKFGIALARKNIAKRLTYGFINYLVDEEGFVQKNIFGVKPLYDEKNIDTTTEQDIIDAYSEYLRDIPVEMWQGIDYQGIRMSRGFDSDLEKRQKVVEYLDYQKRMKKLEKRRRR